MNRLTGWIIAAAVAAVVIVTVTVTESADAQTKCYKTTRVTQVAGWSSEDKVSKGIQHRMIEVSNGCTTLLCVENFESSSKSSADGGRGVGMGLSCERMAK